MVRPKMAWMVKGDWGSVLKGEGTLVVAYSRKELIRDDEGMLLRCL